MDNDTHLSGESLRFDRPQALRGVPPSADGAPGSWPAGILIMTQNNHIEIPITSSKAFQQGLAMLVESAIENDVTVRGAWEFETPASAMEWDVNISEVDRTPDADGNG